jgi:hypothetical protein
VSGGDRSVTVRVDDDQAAIASASRSRPRWDLFYRASRSRLFLAPSGHCICRI